MTASSKLIAQFFYRPNLNGTTDSICGVCFCTVVTARTFAQLKTAEVAHLCLHKASEPNQAA